jgi:hypothetical protein
MAKHYEEELTAKIELEAKLEKVKIAPEELHGLSHEAASKLLKYKDKILKTLGK